MLLSFCLAAPSYAFDQACCDDSNDAFECFDDDTTTVPTTCTANGLGSGTTCAADCGCGATCPDVVEPTKGNGSISRITFLGTSPDGPNTKYSYAICKLAGADLSHWVLGIIDCCNNIVSTSAPAGENPGTTCGTDPVTGLFGVKFDETSPLTDCASGTDLYTITLSGTPINVCTKVATKADGMEDTATACIPGPFCDCAGRGGIVCGDGTCSQPCEDCNNCPQDCSTCGDGCCVAPEDKCTCPGDCGAPVCGDGVCEC
ncbi:MAG: hypothetical protein IID42_12880, partial [Planctomycetes bacterium]|nr:hypothetical protein [Planctomycetota bacterium]